MVVLLPAVVFSIKVRGGELYSHKQIRVGVCVFWIIGMVSFTAGLAQAITLGELIEMALEKDPAYKSRWYEASARKALGWQARLNYGPALRASASYGKGKNSLQLSGQDVVAEEKSVDFHQPEYLFSFTQPVINFKKFYLARWGGSEITAAEVEQKQAEEELILRISERYFALLTAEENCRLAQEENNSLKKQMEDASLRLLLGYGTITDEQSAQSRYAISQASLLERETERDRTRRELEEVVGVDFHEKIDDFPEEMALPEIPKDISYWQEVALQFNSAYRLAQIQQAASKEKLRAAQGGFLPSIDFFANYSRKEPTNTLADYGETRKEAIFGVRAEVELLSSGRDSFAVAAASRELEASELGVAAEKRHLLSTLQNIWLSLHNTLALIECYKTAVKSSEQFMVSTKEGYLEGRFTLLDVLNSQQEYFHTVSQYRASRYSYYVLCQQFKKTLGISNDFQLPTQIYQQAEINEGENGESNAGNAAGKD